MIKRLITRSLLAFALALASVQALGQATPQLRDEVMRLSSSMALPATWVHEELRSTGFLDDPKTREIVARSPPAYALAWAALQAEQAQAGAAMQLLQTVGQGIAAHHSDAIRHEPALATYFGRFPKDAPVPSPTARQFTFARAVQAEPGVAQRLPASAQALLEPLAKYAYAHPGGVHGMMVDVLGIAPTDAMSIEQSSRDVGQALVTAVQRAPIPPPPEAHLKDLVSALLTHGGEAIRYEDVVRRFDADSMPQAGSPRDHDKPLIAAREGRPTTASVEARHDRDAVAALAGRLMASLEQNPNDPPSGSAPSLPSSTPPWFPTEPSFDTRVRQLHSEGIRPSVAMPRFATMRAIGGGRGGGGIVMGSPVTATVPGRPIGVSFRPIERTDFVIAVVAMSDGRVLYGPPVRPDVLLAAQRIAFGDVKRGVAPMPAKPSEGAVLISVLVSEHSPIEVSEFLVHPAIADLQVGRDLIVTDGADFLFSNELEARLGPVPSIAVPDNAADLSVDQWRAAMTRQTFGGWYRYAERPSAVSLRGDVLVVTATKNPNRDVLFELVRPAEVAPDWFQNGARTSPVAKALLKQLQERSAVIRGAPDALVEFRALNDFLKMSAIMRWAGSEGANWVGRPPDVRLLASVRSVVQTANSTTFDPRGAVDIELERARDIAKALPPSVPLEKRGGALRLNQAIANVVQRNLVHGELRSRGYSSRVTNRAMERLWVVDRDANSSPVRAVLMDILRSDMAPAEFKKLKDMCDEDDCDDYIDEVLRKEEPWAQDVFKAWEGP